MESPANVDNDTGQGSVSSGSESSSRKRPQTVSCFLCGGTQIYPGPRYENHLINEHGVLDIDFMIAITLYKQKHGSNPSLENPIDSKEPTAIANNVKGNLIIILAQSYYITSNYKVEFPRKMNNEFDFRYARQKNRVYYGKL